MNQRVGVVDDDPAVREGLEALLRSNGIEAESFATAQELLAVTYPLDCLVLDMELPGLNGLQLQAELLRRDAQVPIVFLTAHGDIPSTVRAVKAGAYEFLTKPCDPDTLVDTVRAAMRSSPARRASGLRLIGRSPAFQRVLREVELVASTDSTVLLLGESGTGKELVAQEIHARSRRHGRPLVSVSCAAIPATLIESELFGHERGAFTGATSDRVGRFEAADHGTIFLDEIGELPLELQAKLLRVLQEQAFERVGSSRTRQLDVRVIAATNRDLLRMVQERSFREDLYYRLTVFPLTLPPLRQRPGDIPLLTQHFLRRHARRLQRPVPTLTPDVLHRLATHPWPGNVRELQNVIERALILTRGRDLEVSLQPLRAQGLERDERTLEEVQRDHVTATLEATNWVVGGPSGAAAILGMRRTSLLHRMAKLGISRPNA